MSRVPAGRVREPSITRAAPGNTAREAAESAPAYIRPIVPRGLDFLFSRNRLNVAISRAQYRVPGALAAPTRRPLPIEQMRLANALCRLVEQAEYFEARARRPAAAARDLETQLKDELGWIVDVHPVVVLWAQFPAGEAALGGVAVVRGDRLGDWLRRQPKRISAEDQDVVRSAVAALPAAV